MPNMRDCCVNFNHDTHNTYMRARTEIRMRVCTDSVSNIAHARIRPNPTYAVATAREENIAPDRTIIRLSRRALETE